MSLDSNYKLLKNQNGEVFARFVGTNCRNGPSVKKIWVLKSLLHNLQENVIMTPPKKKRNPRANSSHGPKSSNGRRPTYSHTNVSSHGNKQRPDKYVHYSSNHCVNKSSKNFSAYSFEYYTPAVKRNAYSSMSEFSINALRYIASQPPVQMWVVKKKNLSLM